MNPWRSRCERVGGFSHLPGEERCHERNDIHRDQPHRQVFEQEVREEGNGLELGHWLLLLAGRQRHPVLLHQPEVDKEQGKIEQGQDNGVERKEALHRLLAHLGAATEEVGDSRADHGDGVGNLQPDFGRKEREIVHGEQVAAKAKE